VIVIARDGRICSPVEDVWAVVGRIEELPGWLAGLRQVRAYGEQGYGRRLWLTGSRTGDGLDRQAEIIAWMPPTLLAWRCVAERRAGGHWAPTRPDELHVELAPDGDGTRVRLYAVCPAGALSGLRLRLEPGKRWRDELTRSIAALAALFPR
jgi:uncharacterized membrane protein